MAKTGTVAVDNVVQVADLYSNELELEYSAKTDLAYRKKLGQFFTPYSVACFMGQWITGVPTCEARILDPCAGLGIFERALCSINPDFAATARFSLWEKDQELAQNLSDICGHLGIRHTVTSEDFVNEHAWSAAYDGIIANPPYYKHHYVENKQDVCDAVSSQVDAPFSIQTNIYCWFLIKSLALLKSGGRLAFIIPAEFLNANYGRDVKKHLLETGYLRHIISICYRSKTFDDAITTACVLLAEKGAGPSERIRFYRAESHDQLDEMSGFLAETSCREYKLSDLDIGHKWRSYFPGIKRIEKKTSHLVRLSTYGRFSRGIATGANEFFAIRPSIAERYDLPAACLIPCLSKARQAPGKAFTQQKFEALKQADKPVLLFDGEAICANAVENYVKSGEESGYQRRYLTRMRKPWYALEKRTPSKIWAGVFGRAGIRFIWNESDCITLTCFHVFQPNSSDKKYLPLLFLYLNSATGQELLELEKREYGDGLEKCEPNDINKALVPDFRMLAQDDLNRLIELQMSLLVVEEESSEEESILREADDIFSVLIRSE